MIAVDTSALLAIAKRDDLPLLFKGNDFIKTDLVPAVSLES